MSGNGLGQPFGAVGQIAYVVDDLERAVDHYTDVLHVGPWFIAEHFAPQRQLYRGEKTGMDASIATAYTGALMIELIEQHDAVPSVYRDTFGPDGHGFHHWAQFTEAFDAEHARFSELGYAPAFEVWMPKDPFGGSRVTYFDTRRDVPGMIELIEVNAHVSAMFGAMHAAASEWDGKTRRVPAEVGS